MSTGLADRRLGGRAAAQPRRASASPSGSTRRPAGLAGVGAEDPRAAGVGDDGDAVARAAAAGGEQRGDVEHLADRVGADHARRGGTARRRSTSEAASSAPVCEDAARCPAAERPLLTAITGLCAATPARDAAELARVAERLEVEQRSTSVPASCLPVLQEVVAGEVGLVARSRRTTTARCPRARGLGRCAAMPNAPLWEAKRDAARRRRAGREASR